MAATPMQASVIPTPRAILAPRAKCWSGCCGGLGVGKEDASAKGGGTVPRLGWSVAVPVAVSVTVAVAVAMMVALGPKVAGRRLSGSRSLAKMKNLKLSTLQSPESV